MRANQCLRVKTEPRGKAISHPHHDLGNAGHIEVVIDWKSDVNPGQAETEQYRSQVGCYLTATGAQRGLIVFMTPGRVEEVRVAR